MTEPAEAASVSRARQLAAAAVIVVVAVAGVVVARAGEGEPTTARPDGRQGGDITSPDVGVRDARAIELLSDQERALKRSSRPGYADTWDPRAGAQRGASIIYANLAALRVGRLHARYVGEDSGGLSGSELRRWGDAAWNADVEVAWRSRGVDRADVQANLTYTFVERDGKVYVADIASAAGERTPIWLLGPLDVRRSGRTVAASTDHALAGRLDEALRQAVRDVQRVVPSWRGDLVAYGPSTQDEFDTLIAAAPQAYTGIAAVTTTVDGSRDPERRW